MRQRQISKQKEPVADIEHRPPVVLSNVVGIDRWKCVDRTRIRLGSIKHTVAGDRPYPARANVRVDDQLLLVKHAAGLIRVLNRMLRVLRLVGINRLTAAIKTGRRVEVRRIKLMHTRSNHIIQRQRSPAKELLVHSDGIMQRVRRSQIWRRLNRLVACGSGPSRAGSNILRRNILRCTGGRWTNNLRLYLVRPVRLQRGDHVIQLVAVIEDSEPGVEDRLRRDSIANRHTRRKVMMVPKMVLRLITNTIADGEILTWLPIVFGIQAKIHYCCTDWTKPQLANWRLGDAELAGLAGGASPSGWLIRRIRIAPTGQKTVVNELTVCSRSCAGKFTRRP